MPHDHDTFDGPPDLHDFIARLENKVRKSADGEGLGGAWEPLPPPATRRRWRAVAWTLVVAAAAALAAIAIRAVTRPPAPLSTVYAQRDVRVYRGVGRGTPPVRTLKPGERVLAGERDGSGWSRVYEADGHPIGYAYRSNDNFGQAPPAAGRALGLLGTGDSEPARRPTALCRDGTYWYGTTHSGSCSHHRGVKEWLTPGDSVTRGGRP
ncbi:MAG TPA: DUF3761 domain-containing protein [Longimicrobium sp.]|nr:DUF3761 domain-containing protein [Longimicrobium sp.]